MNHECVLEGNAFINGSFQHCCIGIDDGKIMQIKKILTGNVTHKFTKHIILPAGIDIHVHFRDPGMTYKENFLTGSRAAAYGGISCVFDMPNTIPTTTTLAALKEKMLDVSPNTIVDFGLYAGITDNTIQNIGSLSTLANGFKIFLGSTTNSLLVSPSRIEFIFQQVEKTRLPLMCHAEDLLCLQKHTLQEQTLSDHHRARPPSCETQAIESVLKEMAKYSLSLHLCHISSKEAVQLLDHKPSKLTYGVTPHHSLLNTESLQQNDGRYKTNPPLRPKDHMNVLFEALTNGSADTLESDHAPHLLEEKTGDFNLVPSGVPGVETMFPLFLYFAKKNVISFHRLISLQCTCPAALLGVFKGKIEKAYDADFIAVDLKNVSRITSENLHSQCGWTPFEDWPAIFPDTVFIRGEKVIEHNEIQVNQGFGTFVGGINHL